MTEYVRNYYEVRVNEQSKESVYKFVTKVKQIVSVVKGNL